METNSVWFGHCLYLHSFGGESCHTGVSPVTQSLHVMLTLPRASEGKVTWEPFYEIDSLSWRFLPYFAKVKEEGYSRPWGDAIISEITYFLMKRLCKGRRWGQTSLKVCADTIMYSLAEQKNQSGQKQANKWTRLSAREVKYWFLKLNTQGKASRSMSLV